MTTKRHFKPVDEQIAYLRKGAAEIIREEDLRAKLEASTKSGKPLRVYLGVDPTAPDLHLGHTVVLRKLKHFQDLGHTAIFLIGDFSAMIGDPTGVSETRPPLTREQVDAHAKTYLAQVFKILDPKQTEVRYNSEWLGKMAAGDVVRLCSHYRLARMLEREDFRSRLAANQPISVHELLYPLLTAYDAVMLQSDVELGATEQKFNILVHREIQREYGLSPQVVLTMPILVGLDGQRKMSKSLGNYIGITESPSEMFGKVMRISDETMWLYYELLTDFSEQEITELRNGVKSGGVHPRDAKVKLAKKIVDDFHSVTGAGVNEGDSGPVTIGTSTAAEFDRVFRDRELPEQIKEIKFERHPVGLLAPFGPKGEQFIAGKKKWSQILAYLGEIESISEADRVVKQGGLEINGKVITDPTTKLDPNQAGTYNLRIGKKKFLRIVVE